MGWCFVDRSKTSWWTSICHVEMAMDRNHSFSSMLMRSGFLYCYWLNDPFLCWETQSYLSCPTIYLNKCRYFPQFWKLVRQKPYWIKIAHKNFVVLVSIYPCLHSTCILKCLPSYLNTFMLMLCIQMYVSICLPPPSCISKRVFQRHM